MTARNITNVIAALTASFVAVTACAADLNPVASLAGRVAPGIENRIDFVRTGADSIYFTVSDLPGGRLQIEGNDNVSLAVGLNHYLRDFMHAQVSWASPTVAVPDTLPPVGKPYTRSTTLPWRYYLNYCTHSYSMAFWDWERWQQEIDWMALHGINLPLAATGMEAVWQATLQRLGYDDESIRSFIAGPGFQAWWLMNNLEGWGGPVDDRWIERNRALQCKIVDRMRELDIHPVFPGYSGMVPHDARQRLGLDVADPGLWCGFTRPAFLQPTDPAFDRIADTYYQELTRLYGPTTHYSMDPFHEGGNTGGVDLTAAGKSILGAMHRASPGSVWVIQGWQGNPRAALIDSIAPEHLLILDLWAESAPQWRTPLYGAHPRIHCLLLNYGGNDGLHGKMRHTVNEYAASAAPGASASPLQGVGATMEGIGNNEVMFSLIYDLPWQPEVSLNPDGLDGWLARYTASRYGNNADTTLLLKAWKLLEQSVYNCPADSRQQGPTESIFCARPSLGVRNASSWANAEMYWDPTNVAEAAHLLVKAAPTTPNNNYSHDLADLMRQSIADVGRVTVDSVMSAIERRDTSALSKYGNHLLQLIKLQDQNLAAHNEFNVQHWIEQARQSARECGTDEDLNEWNARTQITVWGPRAASENGGLHDYANKEWAGLLSQFYYPRWEYWLKRMHSAIASGEDPAEVDASIDWFSIEEPWTRAVSEDL